MPKIVDRPRAKTEIREAARAVYAERGLARTGLVHVARRVGMSRASLYHYYPTREALLVDIADELLREEIELFARATGERQDDPVEIIVDVAATVTRLYGDWAKEGRLVLQFWAEHPERFRKALASIRNGLARLIARGQRERRIDRTLDPQAAAMIVAGIIDGVLLQCFLDPRAFADAGKVTDTVRRAVTKVLQR